MVKAASGRATALKPNQTTIQDYEFNIGLFRSQVNNDNGAVDKQGAIRNFATVS